jgi:hypothetical protein
LSESFVTEDGVVLVWVESDRDERIVYAQSLDAQLRTKVPMQKLTKINVENNRKIKRPAKYNVLSNPDVKGGEIVVVEEKVMYGDGNIRAEVKTFDANFKLVKTIQQELPFEFKQRKGLFSSSVGASGMYYYYGDDGNLHFKTNIYYSRDERKELKEKGEWEDAPGSFYSVIDIKNETIKSIPFKFKGRDILDYNFSVAKDGIKIYGFYHDDDDKSSYGITGVFYLKLSSALDIEVKRFNPFTAGLLSDTFSDDDVDRKGCLKDGICCFKNTSGQSVRKGSSLSTSYTIEKSIITNNDITLFCSMTENYTYQTCDNDGNCTTHYYCLKYNVTCFKVDLQGNLIWMKNINRLYRYEAWDVMDLEVIATDNGYYVMYNSVLDKNGKRKEKDVRKNTIDYVYFEKENGDAKVDAIMINSASASKSQKKNFDLMDIYTVNNTFYILTDPQRLFLGCFWITLNKKGYIGRLEPLEKR